MDSFVGAGTRAVLWSDTTADSEGLGQAAGITATRNGDGAVVVTVGSGVFRFESEYHA